MPLGQASASGRVVAEKLRDPAARLAQGGEQAIDAATGDVLRFNLDAERRNGVLGGIEDWHSECGAVDAFAAQVGVALALDGVEAGKDLGWRRFVALATAARRLGKQLFDDIEWRIGGD